MRIIQTVVNISNGDRHLSIQLPEDIIKGTYQVAIVISPQSSLPNRHQRPSFGFMKNTGEVLGDVISPVLSEADWNALR